MFGCVCVSVWVCVCVCACAHLFLYLSIYLSIHSGWGGDRFSLRNWFMWWWRQASPKSVGFGQAEDPGKSCSLSLKAVLCQNSFLLDRGLSVSRNAFCSWMRPHPHYGGWSVFLKDWSHLKKKKKTITETSRIMFHQISWPRQTQNYSLQEVMLPF